MAQTTDALVIAKAKEEIAILPRMANRHGLIAGAERGPRDRQPDLAPNHPRRSAFDFRRNGEEAIAGRYRDKDEA